MNRVLVAVIVVAVTLVVAGGIAVGIYFAVRDDGDDGDSGGDDVTTATPVEGYSVKGEWGRWDSWSQCSQTCGGGIQRRERACADPAPENGGADCVGKGQEERPCAHWKCPDCSRVCPSGGTLTECAVCKCAGDVLDGSVQFENVGLAAVEVYVVGQEWESSTSTGATGAYQLQDICLEDLQLLFKKTGYVSTEDVYNVTASSLDVKMTKTYKPSITLHPEPQAAFSGDNVKMMCRATGSPQPQLYEWFKDGDILVDVNGEELKMTSVLPESAGIYKCRASSAAGKTFSKSARLIVSDSEDDSCDSVPRSKVISLPSTCHHTAANNKEETSVNVGYCPSQRCAIRGGQTDDVMCCGELENEQLLIECDEFSYYVSKVKSCGCVQCDVDDEVTLNGNLIFQEDVSSVQVESMGQSVTTDVQGGFSISGLPDSDVITVNVISTRNFMGQLANIPLKDNVKEYFIQIDLKQKPSAISIDASSQSEVPLGGDTLSQAAKLIFQNGSIIEKTTGAIENTVKVFASFDDPRSEDGLVDSPGDFSFEDEEGERQELESYGVVRLTVEDNNGNPAFVSGPMGIQVDTQSLGINEKGDGQPDAMVWTMNMETGQWENPQPLVSQASGRKRRQAGAATVNFELPRNVPYINIDKPLLRSRQCYVSVNVYADVNMTEGLGGQRILSYIKNEDGTLYRGRSSGYTDVDGHTCLIVGCGWVNELIVNPYTGLVATESHHLPSGFPFTNTHNMTRVTFTAPPIDDVADGSGPVHRYTLNTCYGSNQADFHFQFVLAGGLPTGRLDAVELRPNKTLSWYNGSSTETRQACFVGVRVLTLNPGKMKVVASSQLYNETGASFGSYTAGLARYLSQRQEIVESNHLGDGLACVQVKCPGDVYDDVSGVQLESVNTRVQINLVGDDTSKCYLRQSFDDYNYYYYDYDVSEDHVSVLETTNSSLTLDLTECPDCPSWYRDRSYHRAIGTRDSASRRARAQCFNDYNNNYLAVYDCAEGQIPFRPHSGSGVA